MNSVAPIQQELFLLCRSGFEKECLAEALDVLAHFWDLHTYGVSKEKTGFVRIPLMGIDPSVIASKLEVSKLVFARQCFISIAQIELPQKDRISAIAPFTRSLPKCHSLLLETADSELAKPMATFATKFSRPLSDFLTQSGKLSRSSSKKILPLRDQRRLHLCFISEQHCVLGYAQALGSSALPGGIRRLKFPKDAPSRSTLKLEEAWHVMIPDQYQESWVKAGMKACDLGAAPGGWTYQLVAQGMEVIAVDNGPMQPELMKSGFVQHLRHDGFNFRPEKPIDWMVCDMAEQPNRVAELVVRWFTRQNCRFCIFNLKLPMKKRYQVFQEIQQMMIDKLRGKLPAPYQLSFKHLYHDREEITGFLRYKPKV